MAANDKLHQFVAYQKACHLFDLVVAERVQLCEEIVAILSAPIRTLRAKS
jgi:hypothetical protein